MRIVRRIRLVVGEVLLVAMSDDLILLSPWDSKAISASTRRRVGSRRARTQGSDRRLLPLLDPTL